MNKTLVIVLAVVIAIGGLVTYNFRAASNISEKIYVAVEGEGAVAVINPHSGSVIKRIDLAHTSDGEKHSFMPHNIQVAPDGKTVWVTANASAHAHSMNTLVPTAYAQEHTHDAMSDQVIVIDVFSDFIIKRIDVGPMLHLAHVAFSPDGLYAYATAQEGGMIYKINAHTFSVEKSIRAPLASQPHGLRIAPNGSVAYVALLSAKSLGTLDLKTDEFKIMPLEGQAVQAGIAPDGATAMVSMYDTKSLALYNVAHEGLSYARLPEGAKGPIQMYPTPDSRFVYLADQGYYFGQPTGDTVYKIDVATSQVVASIKAGSAPHGVVVSKDGTRVYVTNLVSGDVSIIDATKDVEVARIPVGKEPNGISVWTKDSGGMP